MSVTPLLPVVNQRWLPWFGGFLFVLSQLIVVLFGFEGLAEPRVALQYGVMTVAALLLLVAGSRERYAVAGVRVRWHQLTGASMVLLGLGLSASYVASLVGRGSDTAGAFVAVAAVGSLTLVWFGYQVAYATRHVRLEPDPRDD
ncbi:MAG: hypothetical protein V5A62_04975 [Haloarculaceae archaeon]